MILFDLFNKNNKSYLYTKEELEKYQHFIKKWEKILKLSYDDILKEQSKSNIQVLERKIQDWVGYDPKETESVSYGLIVNEYKFLESNIKTNLLNVLINGLDADRFKNNNRYYKIEDIKLISTNDYNNIINNDINKLKKSISEVNNLKEDRFEATIINNKNENIYSGSKSINMLDIPKANSDDLVVMVYYDKYFYSYEFLILSKDKFTDVFFWTSD